MLTIKQIIKVSRMMEQTDEHARRESELMRQNQERQVNIVENPWEFACKWYDVNGIHRSITRAERQRQLGDLSPVPTDVYSREFAEWLADQYRLAMRKGAELATAELRSAPMTESSYPEIPDNSKVSDEAAERK